MLSAKNPQTRLRHILEHIDGIQASIAGLTFYDISGNYLYERAVERAIQIISEAAKELPDGLRQHYPDVHWKPIIGISNMLRHEYYRIRSRDMWDITSVHLPALRPVILMMLEEIDGE